MWAVENFSSVYLVNSGQFALEKLMYVLLVDFILLISDVMVICSGRWSEPRDVSVDHWQVGRQSKEARERSGDVQLDSVTRVGVFSFKMPISESLIHWAMA